MSNATVDALGMCLATSLYWYGLLRQAISLISVWGKCTHIGVGFDVVLALYQRVHSKTTILICYLLDYQQVRENTNVSIILLGDKKEPTK